MINKPVSPRVLICLLTTGSLSLTACGGGAADTAGEDDAITAIVLSGGSYDPCFEEFAQSYTEETGVDVDVINEGYPTLRQNMLTALSGGGGSYDVMMIAYQWTGEFAQFLEPLDERLQDTEQQDIIPSVLDSYRFEDTTYAVPFVAQAESLFYRTDLLEEAGFEPPTTWEEFDEIAEFFTNNPDYPDVYGTSVKASEGHAQTQFNNRYFGLGGGDLGTPGSELDVEIATQALEDLKRAAEEYSPSGALQASFVEVSAQLAAGDVAMAELMPNTVLPQITIEDPDNEVLDLIGVAPVPGGIGEAGGWGLGVPSTSGSPDAAWGFVEHMTSPDADLTCFTEYGKSPIYPSTYEDPEVDALFYSQGIRAALESSAPRPSGETAGALNTMFTDVIVRYLAGQIPDAETAAQEMAEQYADLV